MLALLFLKEFTAYEPLILRMWFSELYKSMVNKVTTFLGFRFYVRRSPRPLPPVIRPRLYVVCILLLMQ